MKLRPLDDGVVIKQLEAKEKPQVGKVIAAGPGKVLENGKRAKMSVKKNDEVIYGKYSGHEVEVDGEKLVIIHESDILGIVEQ